MHCLNGFGPDKHSQNSAQPPQAVYGAPNYIKFSRRVFRSRESEVSFGRLSRKVVESRSVKVDRDSNCIEKTMGKVRRIIYLVIAGICLVLAILGAILPFLPATPFVLLASFLLLRASPTMHEKLLRSKLFGELLRDWQQHRAIRQSTQFRACFMVVLAVILMIVLIQPPLIVVGFSTLGATVGLLIIACIPVLPDRPKSPSHQFPPLLRWRSKSRVGM